MEQKVLLLTLRVLVARRIDDREVEVSVDGGEVFTLVPNCRTRHPSPNSLAVP